MTNTELANATFTRIPGSKNGKRCNCCGAVFFHGDICGCGDSVKKAGREVAEVDGFKGATLEW